MKKHAPADEMKRDLDILLSRVNALEVGTSDEFQKSILKILRALIEGQAHSINEFEHLKKALDLLMLELFKAKNKDS